MFEGEEFEVSRRCLDAVMRKRSAEGLGATCRKPTESHHMSALRAEGREGAQVLEDVQEPTNYQTTSGPERATVPSVHGRCVQDEPREDRKKTDFYFTPRTMPKDVKWYLQTPVGHNTLQATVKRLCKAGLEGTKTNHSEPRLLQGFIKPT
ncbi:uncharacterized protein LOC125380005 [Haliotis rufescens]|uniref:uncharacterized protein LOC125380005 n=1 Tax=Haliotis rufescens TaxID=6454 RepID=UPI00201FABE9|nr:uncharacterized protein LOC125380005 [Haliotis rufescens]